MKNIFDKTIELVENDADSLQIIMNYLHKSNLDDEEKERVKYHLDAIADRDKKIITLMCAGKMLARVTDALGKARE